MTIQPELPWNVAGIAPEARDAARASARREGLSVGEWLTRRILRGLAETEPTTEDWWTSRARPSRARENHAFSNGNTDTLPRASHTEIDTHESRRRIQNQLKSLSLSAEQIARDPVEYHHAASNAATETTVVAREQARVIEQLAARVAQLDSRLAQIERRPPAENARDKAAIETLQEGLARLAVQVSQTASRSATQSAQLATAIESVAGKFSQSRSEIQNLRQDFENRVSALAGNFGSIDEKLFKSGEETEEQLRAVQERIAALETTIEGFEAGRDSLARLSGSIEALTRRFETNEAEHFEGVARLENRVSAIEAASGEEIVDKRLQGIEQTLADMAQAIEKHAQEKAGTSEAIQSELRNLASRIAASEQRDAPPVAKASPALEREERSVPPFLHRHSNVPIFDHLPFPEKPPANFDLPPAAPPASPPWHDLRSDDDSAGMARRNAAQALGSAGADSFLAAARRTARAANSSPAQQRNAPFSWLDPGIPQQANENSNTRILLLGGIGLLVLSAVGAGLYFSSSVSQKTGIPQTTHVGPPSAATAAKATVRHIQPAQSISHLVFVPAPPAKTTSSAAAPKPAPFARESTVPAPASRRMNAQADAAPAAQSAAKPVTAQARLEALAKSGNAKAEEVLGLQCLDGDGVAVNEAEGAKWLERAAAQGEAVAAYRLGTLYERGHGVPADPARAARWYAVAAKAGNRKAMHNLAVAYAQGTGVHKDIGLAAQWFLRAATAGMADSQFNLAVLYERGMGVQQSLVQAYKWYAIAATQGDPESKVRMEAIASQLGAADKAAAEKAADNFQPAPVDRAANAPPIAASLVGG